MHSRANRPPGRLHKQPGHATGLVRVGPLMGLAQLVRDLGHDPEAAFAREDLAPEDFADPDAEFSFLRAGRLLAHCVSETGCAHLGLMLGQRIPPSSLGIPGYLLHTARDVRTALTDLVRYFDLHDRGAMLILESGSETTRLGYAIYLPDVAAAEQIYDLSIAVECNIMRSLCGPDWCPGEVRLARSVPGDPGPYRTFFRAPIGFDADLSAIVFPSRWLDHPVPGADPMLHRHLEKEAEKLHAEHPTDLSGQVRSVIRRSLAMRRASAPHVARQLGFHERTLNRRLREAGTNFQEQLGAVRYEVARELLAHTSLPLSRIATALSYGDASAFIRAFKRWSGSPPSDWRRRQGSRSRTAPPGGSGRTAART